MTAQDNHEIGRRRPRLAACRTCGSRRRWHDLRCHICRRPSFGFWFHLSLYVALALASLGAVVHFTGK